MSTAPTTVPDRNVETCHRTLDGLLQGYGERNFAVRFWDGSTLEAETEKARFTIVLHHPGSMRIMFWPFDPLSLGEGYIFNDFDIEGDIFGFMGLIKHLLRGREMLGLRDKVRTLMRLMSLPKQRNERDPKWGGKPRKGSQGIEEDREGIGFHYNRPGEFYKLFLGSTMQYTCAYFRKEDDDIDTAQRQKMDHICRKLRLKPGERMLDIGCGWGGLLIHAAQNYGVEGVGVTLAGKQAEWAERSIAEAGLSDRVKIHYWDFRQMPFRDEFDHASSVGMAEECGRKNLPLYFRKVYEALKPGGSYLHHSITMKPGIPYPRWTKFARKYVFPNGQMHSLNEALDRATAAGFEIRDVENLREHYVKTLTHWTRRVEAAHDEAVSLTDEVNYRIYRLYMAGATLGFDSGKYNLNQSLLVKADNDGRAGVPLTREDWYA